MSFTKRIESLADSVAPDVVSLVAILATKSITVCLPTVGVVICDLAAQKALSEYKRISREAIKTCSCIGV